MKGCCALGQQNIARELGKAGRPGALFGLQILCGLAKAPGCTGPAVCYAESGTIAVV